MKIVLELSTQTVPERNDTDANFTRTNSTQSLAGANRAVMLTTSSVFWMEKNHTYCAKTIVFGRLLMMDCPKHSFELTAL